MSPLTFMTLPGQHGRQIGVATLNSERSLNALTLPMIRALDQQLQIWQADTAIACVVLRGAGDKAFCAGGDVRALRQALIDDPQPAPHPAACQFFCEEYRLDYRIHCYPKPVIVWGHGIVMGGGLGLLVGASHRVLTTASRIAMPEVTIGLYPDVGGSWFLARMPARIGLFLALTGIAINATDALWLNLGDHILPADGYQAMLTQLAAIDWGAPGNPHEQVSRALDAQESATRPASPVQAHAHTIRHLLNQGTLQQVVAAMAQLPDDDPWLAQARDGLRHGCPTSAALSWEIARRAAKLSLAEALRMELTLSVNVCARADFAEGVRALLVDKDRQPHWSRSWQTIDAEWIDSHFRAPWPAHAHPLADLGR